MNSTGITLLIIIGTAAVIGLISFVIFRFTHPKLKEENKKSEQDLAKEALDRVLQPIEDEKTAKEVSEYKESDE